jgi:hypothetical protein
MESALVCSLSKYEVVCSSNDSHECIDLLDFLYSPFFFYWLSSAFCFHCPTNQQPTPPPSTYQHERSLTTLQQLVERRVAMDATEWMSGAASAERQLSGLTQQADRRVPQIG